MIIIAIIIVILIVVILNYFLYKKKKSNDYISMEQIFILQEQSEKLYKKVKLKLFKKYPKKVKNLKFGYICPGAMKTIDYLNREALKKTNAKYRDVIRQISILTDFQFFIEIYVIYKNYIDAELYKEIKFILKNNSCKISQIITKKITELFGILPKTIRQNLPDDFYHIRHNTLICSKDKKLAEQRIELLKSIYGSVESFNNRSQYTECLGKRNGTSGCRDCCNAHFKKNYGSCVKDCMDF